MYQYKATEVEVIINLNLLKKIQIVTDRKTALNYLDKTQVPTYFCGTMEDEQDDVFPAAVCDECPMKCGPGRTYWNGEFEKSGWKSRCNIR